MAPKLVGLHVPHTRLHVLSPSVCLARSYLPHSQHRDAFGASLRTRAASVAFAISLPLQSIITILQYAGSAQDMRQYLMPPVLSIFFRILISAYPVRAYSDSSRSSDSTITCRSQDAQLVVQQLIIVHSTFLCGGRYERPDPVPHIFWVVFVRGFPSRVCSIWSSSRRLTNVLCLAVLYCSQPSHRSVAVW